MGFCVSVAVYSLTRITLTRSLRKGARAVTLGRVSLPVEAEYVDFVSGDEVGFVTEARATAESRWAGSAVEPSVAWKSGASPQ